MSDYVVLQKERGQGVPRRPAAGEDGHRRGRRRGGARRRRDARPRLRPGRLPRRGRARRAAHRPRDRRPPELAQARAGARGRPPAAAASTTPRSCSASPAPTSARRSTSARSSPASSTAASSRSSSRSTAPTLVTGWAHLARLPGRDPRQQRHPVLRGGARRAPSSSSCATRPTSRSCSCRTSPASWSGTRYEQGGIIKDGAKLINAVSNSTVPHLTVMVGASLRRRQLRHVRPRLRPALRLHLAQPPHRGDGAQAARRRADDRRAAEGRGDGQRLRRGGVRPDARRVRAAGRGASPPRCSRPAGSGTTASSTRATPAPCSRSRCRRCTRRPRRRARRASASSGCDGA